MEEVADNTAAPSLPSTQEVETAHPEIPRRRIKMTIAYDGTAYHGWQMQKDRPSVQEEISRTLASIVGHVAIINGSGRTDRGVHARGQVAHCDVVTRIKNKGLFNALNSRLPRDIRIMKLVACPQDFDARFSAHGKEYRYFVWNAPIIFPDKRLYRLHEQSELNLSLMRDAAKRFVGEHDFAAFTANPNREIATTVRKIFDFNVRKVGHEIIFSVKGGGFLYKQVRSMVGFLLRVGEGEEPPEAVTELLEKKESRTARVPSAPAQGLFLWEVWYKGQTT